MHFVVRGEWDLTFDWVQQNQQSAFIKHLIPVAVPQMFQTNLAKLCHLAGVLENRSAGSCALLVDA